MHNLDQWFSSYRGHHDHLEVFLQTSSQVTWRLLVWEPHFENHCSGGNFQLGGYSGCVMPLNLLFLRKTIPLHSTYLPTLTFTYRPAGDTRLPEVPRHAEPVSKQCHPSDLRSSLHTKLHAQLSPSAPYPEWHSPQPPATHLRAPKIPFCSMTPHPFLAQRKSLAQSSMWSGVEGP